MLKILKWTLIKTMLDNPTYDMYNIIGFKTLISSSKSPSLKLSNKVYSKDHSDNVVCNKRSASSNVINEMNSNDVYNSLRSLWFGMQTRLTESVCRMKRGQSEIRALALIFNSTELQT